MKQKNANFTFVREVRNLSDSRGGSVATIGSFDGVHRGHQEILRQLCENARKYGLPSIAMIFEPQPQEFFSGEKAPPRLMRMRDKIEAICSRGVDRVYCLQFNRSLRGLSAEEFVQQILVDGIGCRCLVIGDDFHFGCDRRGDYAMLQQVGPGKDFEVMDTCTITHAGERISSSRIREALEVGDFDLAAELLGAPFRIAGRVVYGQQLGGTLGIPTVNVHLNRYRAPLSGVFAVRAQLGDRLINGVANVGVRPTVGDLIKPILEVHLLDFNEDIYRQRIKVEFCRKLRDEQAFSSLEELLDNIRGDIAEARTFFARENLLASRVGAISGNDDRK